MKNSVVNVNKAMGKVTFIVPNAPCYLNMSADRKRYNAILPIHEKVRSNYYASRFGAPLVRDVTYSRSFPVDSVDLNAEQGFARCTVSREKHPEVYEILSRHISECQGETETSERRLNVLKLRNICNNYYTYLHPTYHGSYFDKARYSEDKEQARAAYHADNFNRNEVVNVQAANLSSVSRDSDRGEDVSPEMSSDVFLSNGTLKGHTPEYANSETRDADIALQLKNNSIIFSRVQQIRRDWLSYCDSKHIKVSDATRSYSERLFKDLSLDETASDFSKAKAYHSQIQACRSFLKEQYQSLFKHGCYSEELNFFGIHVCENSGESTNYGKRTLIFNEARGLSLKDADGRMIARNTRNGMVYPANVLNLYALSQHEMDRLESGQYIIVPDIPNDGVVGTYVCRLESNPDFDLDRDKYWTHRIRLEEISWTDERFCDPEANEYYQWNNKTCDKEISEIRIGGSKRKELKAEDVSISEIKEQAYKERINHRGKNDCMRRVMSYAPIKRYQPDNLMRTYFNLRQEPASEKGKEMGFETMYDEKRFNSNVHYTGSRIRELQQKLKEYSQSGIASDALERYSEALDVWKMEASRLGEEAKLRQIPATDERYKSAWEEKVATEYAEERERLQKGYVPNEESRARLWKFYRLSETLEIRDTGHLPSSELVGTENDKYATLGAVDMATGVCYGEEPDFY